MSELVDSQFAISDSIDRLSAAVQAMRPPDQSVDSPLRCTVAHVASAAGWRVLIGELVDGQIIFTQLPLLSWITKVVHAIGNDDIYQIPLVWDAERQRGVELDVYLKLQRCSSLGVTARILAPGQEALSASEVADFEAEIRDAFRSERREMNAAIEAENRTITAPRPRRHELAQEKPQ